MPRSSTRSAAVTSERSLALSTAITGALLRVAQLYVRDRSVAEEVVQETWLAVLEGIDRFEARSSLKTWIYRILTNRAKTRAQREHRQLPFSALVTTTNRRSTRRGSVRSTTPGSRNNGQCRPGRGQTSGSSRAKRSSSYADASRNYRQHSR